MKNRTPFVVTSQCAVALGLAASVACGEAEVEREVSGEWLDVVLPSDVEICAGTLPGYDRFVESVADRWDFELAGWRGQMEVVSPGEQPWASLGCSTQSTGCASPSSREAWIRQTSSGEHELVHLIADIDAPPFFSEGVATYWGSRPFSKWTIPPELVEPLLESQTSTELLEVWNLGYNAAGGFTGRLIEEYGVERYRSFYEDLPRDASVAEIGVVFEDVFGEPLQPQLETLSTEPMCNHPIWACEHGISTVLPIVQDGPLDCDGPDVQGFDSDVLELHAPKQVLHFTLEEETDVEFSLKNVDVVMMRCGECSESEIQTGAFMDEPRVYSDRLLPGTWSVRISNRSSDDMYFGLREIGG
ncbi:MAG: hypothetical protein ACRBN8_02415 [Nannocystales bacterium]